MILRGNHRHYRFSVGKRQHRHFRPGNKFLYYDLVAGSSKNFVFHNRVDRLFRLFQILADHHSLTQGEAVGLDHYRKLILRRNVVYRLFRLAEYLVSRGRYAIFFHQIFRKYLAALNNSGVFPRSKCPDSRLLQGIHHAGCQRIVRRHKHQINIFFFSKRRNTVNILCRNIDTNGVLRNTAVARRAVDFLTPWAFLQLADQSVLPSAGADH